VDNAIPRGREQSTRDAEERRMAADRLADLGHLISRSLRSEEIGQLIVDSVRALLGAQSSALFRLEPESGDLA